MDPSGEEVHVIIIFFQSHFSFFFSLEKRNSEGRLNLSSYKIIEAGILQNFKNEPEAENLTEKNIFFCVEIL